ncbi:MAG: class I SAM-dependent methyltransferase [Planctomycetaceae bacterium]
MSLSSYWNSNPSTSTAPLPNDWSAADGTIVLAMDRYRLLKFLPTRGNVAEIGVARGRFSRLITWHTRPELLALVDPWIHQSQLHETNSHNVGQQFQDRRHKLVSAMFKVIGPLFRTKVEIVRDYSVPAATKFADETFDWVYIDGDHSYSAVRDDLASWVPKLKRDGFILGHDFARHTGALTGEYGVVEAVRDFLAEHPEFRLIATTNEHFPTFVIARHEGNQNLRQFLTQLCARETYLVRVPTESLWDFSQTLLKSSKTRRASLIDCAVKTPVDYIPSASRESRAA